MNLGSNERKHITFDLNVEPTDDDNYDSPAGLDLCSICHEPLVNNPNNLRTLVTLKCSHTFHLDCIGSAFNANNLMQCPNCMQIEPGEWQYATNNPIPDSSDDDSIAEEEEEENDIGLIHDLTLGSELCPFEGSDQQNSSESPDQFGLHNQCIYVEGSFAIPQSFDIVGSIFFPLNSSPLYPHIPLPSNRRIFWSVLVPGVMRGRHYIDHPSKDHSPSNRSDNSMVNVPVATPYQGDSLVANVPCDLSAPVSQVHVFPFAPEQLARGISNSWPNSYGSNQVNDNGFHRFNIWDRQPSLEQWQLNQMERRFYRILYGEDVSGSDSNGNENGSGSENSSGEGHGSDRNGGDVRGNTFARRENGYGNGIGI